MGRKREKQNTADANVNILCTNREQARFRCYFQLIEYLFCFTVSDGNLSSRAEITHGKLCDTVDCVTQIVWLLIHVTFHRARAWTVGYRVLMQMYSSDQWKVSSYIFVDITNNSSTFLRKKNLDFSEVYLFKQPDIALTINNIIIFFSYLTGSPLNTYRYIVLKIGLH